MAGSGEVVAFAQQHGLPIAIKAAFGGGRDQKAARTLEEVPELYASAVRRPPPARQEGQEVAAGELTVVLEAMNGGTARQRPPSRHREALSAEAGGSLTFGAVVCEIAE